MRDIVPITVKNMKGKTKDIIRYRLNLQAMQIRPKLDPVQNGNKLELPPAYYSFSREQKEAFCKF